MEKYITFPKFIYSNHTNKTESSAENLRCGTQRKYDTFNEIFDIAIENVEWICSKDKCLSSYDRNQSRY